MVRPTFGELFMDLMSALATSNKMKWLSTHVNSHQSEEAMFDWIWGLPEAHTCLVPLPKTAIKSEPKAEKLLKQGLDLFNKGDSKNALKVYNRCIMMVPHPKDIIYDSDATNDNINVIKSSVPVSEFKTLVSIYKNRSEVLFKLKDYENCILDINQILSYVSIKYVDDILRRKIKCLIFLGRHTEAESISSMVYQKLNKSDVNLKQEHINNLSINDSVKHNSSRWDTQLFKYQTPDPPKLKACNPNIPSFSDALHLSFSPEKGRYAIAVRDIKPGEIVVVDGSHVSSLDLDMEVLQSHCCYCLRSYPAPVPCLNCDTVVFCNESCRSNAQVRFHNFECELLPTLIALDIGNNAIQTLRLVGKSTFITLRDNVSNLKEELLTKNDKTCDCNSEGLYISNEYRSVYHLESNTKHRSTMDLFQMCAKAFIITKMILRNKDYFVNESNQRFEPDAQDISLLGSTVLHHLLTFLCNAFLITEVEVKDNDPRFHKTKTIGSGIYPSGSLLNHSCDASTFRCSFGNVLVMYAKKFIKAGEEVSDNYGFSYPVVQRDIRLAELEVFYKFDCCCEACENNWGTVDKIINVTKLKAIDNENSTEDNGDACFYDLESRLKTYQKQLYEINSTEISLVDSDKHISFTIEIIEFMTKYVEMPCKDFIMAQMLLTRFLQIGASSIYVEE